MTGAPGPDDLAERHPGQRLGERLGRLRRDRDRGHRAAEDERRDEHDLVVLGVDLGRAEHVEVPRHRRVRVGQAHDHVLALHGLGTEHDARHVDRVLGAARVRHRAHERPVRVADVAVDHLEVALVDRQVDRLAQRPAAVVERPARVGQLHEVAEVLDRGVAPAVVEVVDERRAVGRDEDHVRVADLDAPGGVAGDLGEQARRGRLDERAAHAAREADALAGDVGAGAAEDLGRLGEVDDLDADLFEEGVGVGLDLFEALGRDDLDGREAAGQVRHGVHVACQALGLSRGSATPHRRVFEVRDSHRISSGSYARSCRHHGTATSGRSEPTSQLPTLVEREARPARRDSSRRSGGTRCRASRGRRRVPSRRPASLR